MPPRLTTPQRAARRREILECMASGYTNKEIANELGLSVFTIRSFIQHDLYPWLGITATSDMGKTHIWRVIAVVKAYQKGILKP